MAKTDPTTQGDPRELAPDAPDSEAVTKANESLGDTTKAADNAPPVVDVSADESAKAAKQGVLDAIAENAKKTYQNSAAGVTGDPEAPVTARERFPDKANSLGVHDLLDLPLRAFEDRIKEKADAPLTESQLAGLMEAERSGKNRTEWVKALMKRLDVKSPYEVSDAGPAYTNDTNSTLIG